MGSKKKYLIILRGFPGAGKTQVAKRIVEKLSKQGRDAIFWNLDSFAPDSEEDRFWAGLHEAIKHQYVIAEMYSGRWHSSDPERWIKHFREEYEIHSFLLEISIESGFRNYNDPRHGGTSLDFPQYKDLCERFLKKEGEKEFSLRAKICEEIHKDSESSNWDSIADEIMKDAKLLDNV